MTRAAGGRDAPIWRTLHAYRPNARGIAASAAFSVVAAFAEAWALILVLPLADIVAAQDRDRFVGELGPFTLDVGVSWIVSLILALTALSAVAKAFAEWLRVRAVASWERRYRLRVYNAFLAADYRLQSSIAPAQLHEYAGTHVTQASTVLSRLTGAINSVMGLMILFGTAILLSPIAALTIGAVVAILVLLVRPLGVRVRRASRSLSHLRVDAGRSAASAVEHARDVRVFGAQAGFLARYAKVIDGAVSAQRRANMLSSAAPIVHSTAGLVLVVAALAAASALPAEEVVAVGAVGLILLRSLSYAQQLSTQMQIVNQALPFTESLVAELRSLEDAKAAFGDVPLDQVDSIEFRDVAYAYPGSDSMALSAISFTLARPAVVGLVGRSGSGKSTIAQLILRLRRPSRGSVLVNGAPIDCYSEESWTREVCLVPQETKLIDATIFENIAYFRDGVHESDVRWAVRAAGLESVVDALPHGLHTPLGTTIHDLSGGQRQRLGLARALAGRPSVLVLDEPTSALDADSESWVGRAIKEIGKSALVVVITHRATTLALCERVLEVDEGRIVRAA